MDAETDLADTDDAGLEAETDLADTDDAGLEAETDLAHGDDAALDTETDLADGDDAGLEAETDLADTDDAALDTETDLADTDDAGLDVANTEPAVVRTGTDVVAVEPAVLGTGTDVAGSVPADPAAAALVPAPAPAAVPAPAPTVPAPAPAVPAPAPATVAPSPAPSPSPVPAPVVAAPAPVVPAPVPVPVPETVVPAPPIWPLTGLPGYPEGDLRQAITVKIENTRRSMPQVGIGRADIVVQELVEGGLTRLAAMYHSQIPDPAAPVGLTPETLPIDQVGPVRSMRETDIGLVLPTAGTLAATGGAPSTVEAIKAAGVPVTVERGVGFSRDPSRPLVHSRMLNVSELAATLPPSPPPLPYLPFGEHAADAPATPAAELSLTWPASSSTFTYDPISNAWVKTDIENPADFSFTNVIALSLPVTFSSATDSAGNQIPTMLTTGSGSGVIATGGEVHPVTWEKASETDPWKFTFQPAPGIDGVAPPPQDFLVSPGRTWLALLPVDTGNIETTPPPAPGVG